MNSFELFKNLWALGLDVQVKHDKWWPNYGTFEVAIGAILTQQTKWESVEKSLNNLASLGFLDLETLANANVEIVLDAIKPSGFFNKKSERILNLARKIYKEYGDFESFKANTNRDWLLGIKGIGQESADSILCYACEKDIMVIDSYTARLCAKIYNMEPQSYDELQEFLTDGILANQDKAMALINQDAHLNKIYALFHGLIVEYAKKYIKGQNVGGPLIG